MGRKKEYNTLSRPAIDEKSKGFPGNPAPGIDGMAGAVPDGVSAELDSVEDFFIAGSVVSSE
ncbi:hypothetical protein Hanom_Chr03g00214221 [Helianthus anomalus]